MSSIASPDPAQRSAEQGTHQHPAWCASAECRMTDNGLGFHRSAWVYIPAPDPVLDSQVSLQLANWSDRMGPEPDGFVQVRYEYRPDGELESLQLFTMRLSQAEQFVDHLVGMIAAAQGGESR